MNSHHQYSKKNIKALCAEYLSLQLACEQKIPEDEPPRRNKHFCLCEHSRYNRITTNFEVFMVMVVLIMVFWTMTPYSLVGGH
jgi:hypothetical protein